MYFVYFLSNKMDSAVYVGFTADLVGRIKQHNQGKTKSLKHKIPLKLIYFEAYLDKKIARKREIQLKKSWNEKENILKRLKNL